MLYVFDFDDTIARSNAKVKITSQLSGFTRELSSIEFAKHNFDDTKNYYDFSSFDELSRFSCIHQTMSVLHAVYAAQGSDAITVLTARDDATLPRHFLQKHDLNNINVFAIGHVNSKADWIKQIILEKNLSRVTFYENSDKHIKDVIKMRQTLRGIAKIDIWRVKELK